MTGWVCNDPAFAGLSGVEARKPTFAEVSNQSGWWSSRGSRQARTLGTCQPPDRPIAPVRDPQLVRVVPSGATVALTASAVPVDGALIRTALAPGRPGKRGHMPCASADRLGLCALPPCASYIQ